MPMPRETKPRRSSAIGALLLIALGALFLYTNLRPEVNPWPLLSRYWPLLLVFLGLGKLWDYYWQRNHPDAPRRPWVSGGEIAIIILLLLFGAALSRGIGTGRDLHQAESVERGAADSVRVDINMPAGELKLAGGASKLLQAQFDYDEAEGKPRVSYDVSGNQGLLTVSQPGRGNVHFGRTRNTWDVRLGDDVPMELKVELGAGRGDLVLQGLPLTRLDVEIGAGQLTADLTGNWAKDLDANIHGGVGSATIRLPSKVGVQIRAHGGIGSINASGFNRDGDTYTNDQYGKSPVTLRLVVEGGIGTINLESGS